MRCLQLLKHQLLGKPPLRRVLIVGFVLPLVGAVGGVQYLVWKHEQQVIDQLAQQLQQNVGNRIRERLRIYAEAPPRSTAIIAQALSRGELNVQDLESWKPYLFDYGQVFDTPSFLFFADQSGDFIELKQSVDDQDKVSFISSQSPDMATVFYRDRPHTPIKEQQPIVYDPRTRPWFQQAVKGQTQWTNVYEFVLPEKTLGSTFYRPCYGKDGKTVLGVVAADFTLVEMNRFLTGLKISKSGEAFILDRQGTLIASSAKEPLLGSRNQPRQIQDTKNELIQATGKYLQQFDDLEQMTESRSLSFMKVGKRQLIQVSPFSDAFGLDWVVVVVVPESDFTKSIYANARLTLLLSLGILGVAIVLALAIAEKISAAMSRLSRASQGIAQGNLSQNVSGSTIQELDTMAQAFNHMSRELQQSYLQLADYSHSLESKVQERTQELEQEVRDRKQSEQQFRTLVSNIPGAVYRCYFDANWTMLFISDTIAEISGYPASDFIQNQSRPYSNIILPEDLAQVARTVDQALQERHPYVLHYRIRHADGGIRWVYEKGQGVFGTNGDQVLFLDGAIFDITPQKQVEEAMSQSEQRYHSLFDDAPISLWEEDFSAVKLYLNSLRTDHESKDWSTFFKAHPAVVKHCIELVRILDVNQAALDLFEATNKEDLLARLDHRGSEALDGFQQELISLCRGEISFEQELINYTLAGQKKHIIFKQFMAPGHEQDWSRVLISIIDISDRKQAEESLQHRADMDSLFSQISQMLLDQDVDTAIEFALQLIGEFLGCDRSCIFRFYDQNQFGMTYEWCSVGTPSFIEERQRIDIDASPWFANKLLNGTSFQILNVADLPPEAAAEQVELERQSVKSLLDVPMIYGNRVIGFIGLDAIHTFKQWQPEDVTVLERVGQMIAMAQVRHAAQVDLKAAKELAEVANNAKSEFLANMSHELRSPLNAILGFAQLMANSHTLSSDHLDHIEIINRSGKHLLDLINDVLDMSKIEAGRTALNLVDFDLYRLLDDLYNMFRLRADEKQLQFSFHRVAGLPQYIQADQGKLRQVLINVLSNALKFTESGSVTVSIKSESQGSTETEGTLLTLCFEVADTGPGIDPEDMEQVFEPFVQTQLGLSSQEGTGLGLPISRSFVQLMGGDIALRNRGFASDSPSGAEQLTDLQPHQGTLVTFTIQAETAAAVFSQRPDRRILALASGQPTYRILVVDDKSDNRKLLVKLLERLGVKVSEANNGQVAIQLWQAWQPHLIWMDLRMPIMDGLEATRRIRATDPSVAPQPKILALSASSLKEDRTAAHDVGFDDFLQKPFQEDDIFSAMGQHLGLRYIHEDDIYDDPHRSELPSEYLPIHDFAGLARLSPQLLSDLEAAILRLQWDRILRLIEEIHEQDMALADRLARTVHNFQYGSILKALQVAKEEQ